jgi:hypothetical protein
MPADECIPTPNAKTMAIPYLMVQGNGSERTANHALSHCPAPEDAKAQGK